jgi:hypothetical protein
VAVRLRLSQKRIDVGFANTGLIIVGTGDSASFVLLLNKNLREGKGLWVPPGGHFDPMVEESTRRLKTKIEDEVGLRTEVIPSPNLLGLRVSDLKTTSAAWHDPPLFLLEEDLMGRCSHGHKTHLDYVHLLRSLGPIEGANPKYPATEQVFVRARDCVGGVDEADAAIRAAVEDWTVRKYGQLPGVIDSVTRDVSVRLHLASRLPLSG